MTKVHTIAAPARSPAEMAMVLASLPFSALLPLIGDRAKHNDVAWLRAITENGVLDVARDLDQVGTEDEFEHIASQWCAKCAALAELCRGIELTTVTEDPTYGELVNPMLIPVYRPTTAMSEWFQDAAHEVLNGYRELLNHEHCRWAPDSFRQGLETVSIWIAAASVMDQPETITLLAAAAPHALLKTFPRDRIGGKFSIWSEGESTSLSDYQYAPAFVALQLSRTACLEAMRAVMPAAINLMGERRRPNSVHDLQPFTLAGNIETASLKFMGLPSAFEVVVRQGLMSEEDEHNLKEHGLRALDFWQGKLLHNYVPAFAAAGAYESDSTAALRAATIGGWVELTEVLGNRDDVDWEALSNEKSGLEGPVYRALIATDAPSPNSPEMALAQFLSKAQQAGQLDLFTAPFIQRGFGGNADFDTVEPITAAVKRNASVVLLAFMEGGVDPAAPAMRFFPPPIVIAETLGTLEGDESAAFMRSWKARQDARAVLAAVDSDPRPPGPQRQVTH